MGELLGVGGMGKVYKVRNVISDRVEAAKVLRPDRWNNGTLVQAERFMREIQVLASLSHPYIAALHTALNRRPTASKSKRHSRLSADAVLYG